MPALLIILAIVAFIVALLFLRISLVIEYQEKTVAHLKILFFKKRLFKKKHPKLKRSMSKKEAQKI